MSELSRGGDGTRVRCTTWGGPPYTDTSCDFSNVRVEVLTATFENPKGCQNSKPRTTPYSCASYFLHFLFHYFLILFVSSKCLIFIELIQCSWLGLVFILFFRETFLYLLWYVRFWTKFFLSSICLDHDEDYYLLLSCVYMECANGTT